MVPQNHAAWIPEAKGHLEVKEAPYNSPGPRDIIIRNRAVAINPVDWKIQEEGIFVESYPSIFGCDVAGVVEEVGDEVKQFAPGDRVIGNAVCLTLGVQYAAFQLFVRCPSNVACKLPESLSFEQGCVLPLAINTAGQALFASNRLNLPRPRATSASRAPDSVIFIYAGSTSVGSTAIQLAKAAGITVVTTAGQRNIQYCKNIGADFVFDYKDKRWADQAIEVMSGKRVIGAFDTISSTSTVNATTALLNRAGSDGLVITVSPPPEGTRGDFVFGTSVTNDNDLSRLIWDDFLPHALQSGTFVPKPDPVVAGEGLKDIQKGLDMQRNGVSARKVVITMPSSAR